MKTVLLNFIRFYQKTISPLFAPHCRFYPTCSQYSYESIHKHGFFRGLYLSIIRIGKCHPFHEGGYDPIK